MAINKAKTSVGTKVVLILLIIAFVMSFVSIGANLFSGGSKQATQNAAQGPVEAAKAQYQPAVDALNAQLQSEPTSYTVLVSLGNTYFDWAQQIQQAAQQSKNIPTTALAENQTRWLSAADAYARALKVQKGEPSVHIDYSITQFYSGDTTAAIKTAEATAKDDPTFTPAFFNLGVFYSAAGQNAKAIAAFEQVVRLDPMGKQSNIAYAKQQITALKQAPQAPQSAPSTSTSPTP